MREINEKELLYNSLFVNVITVSEYPNLVALKSCECSKFYNLEQYCVEKNINIGNYCNYNIHKLPDYSRIVAISYATFANVDGSPKRDLKFITGDEKTIIMEFGAVLDYYAPYNYNICGLNLYDFELPILFKKFVTHSLSSSNEIKVPAILKNYANNLNGVLGTMFIDVFKNWSLNYKDPISIATLCCDLGLKIQDGVYEPYKISSEYWNLDGNQLEQMKLIKLNSQNYVNLCCQYINKLKEIQ